MLSPLLQSRILCRTIDRVTIISYEAEKPKGVYTYMNSRETPASNRMKEQIAISLKALMETKPLTKISVREITDNCHINRGTFYYHFQDIYSVVEWILKKEAYSYVDAYATPLTYEDAIRFILDYARDNQYIVKCTLDTFAMEELKRFFHKDIHCTIKNFITEMASDRQVSDDYLDFLTNFYTYALVHLLIEWMKNGMKEDDDTIVRRTRTVVSGTIEQALKNAEEEKC